MLAFTKTIRNANHVRRYTITTVTAGWELQTVQDDESVRRVSYDDWHRVERATRSILQEIAALQESGWTEEELTTV